MGGFWLNSDQNVGLEIVVPKLFGTTKCKLSPAAYLCLFSLKEKKKILTPTCAEADYWMRATFILGPVELEDVSTTCVETLAPDSV